MTDLTETNAGNAAEAPASAPSTVITIALKNGAGNVDVDTAKLPDDVYREALYQGLKALAERNMSKITKANIPDEATRKSEILAKAQANVEDMYSHTAAKPKVKITGAKPVKKASGKVMTEAMRIARGLVKDFMRQNKIKQSTVPASEITAAAKALIENDPSIITTAEANLAAAEAKPIKVDLGSIIKVDPKLVAKDEAAKAKKAAEKGTTLSAKQAGKVAPRARGSKPAPQATAH